MPSQRQQLCYPVAVRQPRRQIQPVLMGQDFDPHQPPAFVQPARQAIEKIANLPAVSASRAPQLLRPSSAPAPRWPLPRGDLWHATVQALAASEAITALVRELALQSQLVAHDGGHWRLRVERESLNQPMARERLRAGARRPPATPARSAWKWARVSPIPRAAQCRRRRERQRVARRHRGATTRLCRPWCATTAPKSCPVASSPPL